MTVAAATSTAVFLAFVTQVLIPTLLRERPNAVVVMDNLAAHKAAVVRIAFDQAGISYRYLPAYSPDMNPIAPAWSSSKPTCVPRRPGPGTHSNAPSPMPSQPLRPATPSNAQGWFRCAGYTPN